MMIELFNEIYSVVEAQNHGSFWTVFFIGLSFGVVIQWTRVDTFEKIAGFSMRRDFTMLKFLLIAIGVTSIGLYFMVETGYASYSPKPIYLGGLIVGGVIFGVGMALFGKCPGTGAISLAEGRVDVLVGIIGGLFGGAVYILLFDDLKWLLGENLGKLQLIDFTGEYSTLFILVFGIASIVASILIPHREIHFDKE
jgi:uncharacterized membrane protein YedE/YeeE